MHRVRSPRTVIRAVGGVAILALSLLLLGAGMAAASPACTRYLDGATPEVFAGEVVCGGPHDDHVGTVDAGGTFIGGDGYDSVDVNQGVFDGGPGGDRVFVDNAGSFYGVDGEDAVEGTNSGYFDGGGSSDQVKDNTGDVVGGDGVDVVFRLDAGTFWGGNGGDIVGRMNGGTYDGGAGHDKVFRYIAGTLISVEVGG